MKIRFSPLDLLQKYRVFPATVALVLIPFSSHADSAVANGAFSVEMSMTSYLIIGFLLVLSIIMFFVFQRRYNITNKELQDITGELGATRKRLDNTSKELEQSQMAHKTTTNRYQGILFDAKVGMFQMDLHGNCTYINSALQEMSGLYLKKAVKDGLPSAIHPDDRDLFESAFKGFLKGHQSFNERFRFSYKKGRAINEVHVSCSINKILNNKNEVESYIGWVSDVTPFHEQLLNQRSETARYKHFVSETTEGYYQLVPESPIALTSSSSIVAEAILNKMVVADCNDTFASAYGAKPADLNGTPINALGDGFGPFANKDDLKAFVEIGFSVADIESDRKGSNGQRLNLIHNVIGIVEDNKLVAIWGTQRNISHQKRETAELNNKIEFLHRILNTLPADVHVKDTRCRYMYASKKLSDRTGIKQENWIGKTIFEVMPGTSSDHDDTAIQTMKSCKLNRIEMPYNVRGKSGWMETVQIPLVSNEGLVEGVVGLSLDISSRKKKEEEAVHYSIELEDQLKQSREELTLTKNEHGKTASAHAKAIQKLELVEMEMANREREHKNQISERDRCEETLRRNTTGLLARQRELEEQLSKRLAALEAETDKRKKWEELLSIKEEELRKIEALSTDLEEQIILESQLRAKAEGDLAALRVDSEKIRKELNGLDAKMQKELDILNTQYKSEIESEYIARTTAEKQLRRTEDLLQITQDEIQKMTTQHSIELEQEVAERKAAAEKLIKVMEELDDLKLQFGQRIEDETKALKQQLAQRQIRETALRQHEKDLEDRIKELEKTLTSKAKAFEVQLEAREGAEVQKQQIEQQLQQMSKRQKEVIARETQKLNLQIAEIRLDEVKLRKHVGDMQRDKASLEESLKSRTFELETIRQEYKRIEEVLVETQNQLKRLSDSQELLIASEKEPLHRQLDKMLQEREDLLAQLDDLQLAKTTVEKTLENRTEELATAAREYRNVVDAYKASQINLKTLEEEQSAMLSQKTRHLENELHQLKITEADLVKQAKQMHERNADQHQRMDELSQRLNTEVEMRHLAEEDLRELHAAFDASREDADSFIREQTRKLKEQVELLSISEGGLNQELENSKRSISERDEALVAMENERVQTQTKIKELEARLTGIKDEHQAELKKSMAEVQAVSRMNSELVDELNDALQESLKPVVKTAHIMVKADNLSPEQKRDMATASQHCSTLMDMITYRSELTHLSDGSGNLHVEQCDLHGLMADVDRQFSQRAETKKLFFAVSFAQYQAAHNVPKFVEADEYKVRRILTILLGYAISTTDKGRLGLHATRKSSSGDTANIAFELAYTGKQDRDPLLDDIFGTRSGEDVVDVKHGLTLARRYIGMLDGEMVLEYRAGGITSLTIQFPFKKMASDAGTASINDNKKVGAA